MLCMLCIRYIFWIHDLLISLTSTCSMLLLFLCAFMNWKWKSRGLDPLWTTRNPMIQNSSTRGSRTTLLTKHAPSTSLTPQKSFIAPISPLDLVKKKTKVHVYVDLCTSVVLDLSISIYSWSLVCRARWCPPLTALPSPTYRWWIARARFIIMWLCMSEDFDVTIDNGSFMNTWRLCSGCYKSHSTVMNWLLFSSSVERFLFCNFILALVSLSSSYWQWTFHQIASFYFVLCWSVTFFPQKKKMLKCYFPVIEFLERVFRHSSFRFSISFVLLYIFLENKI